MEKINSKKFASVFWDIHNSSTDRRFCFILGAGASSSSGIPTGHELSKRWFNEIKERESADDFEKWSKKNNIDEKYIGNYYGIIYKQRFALDIQSGYDILNKVMEYASPSFGYSVLAQLLATTHHNIVITTNFDPLMEEALFTFSYKRFLVCGHESLTGYAKVSLNRPLIAKIHRDLLLHPMSDPDDIKELADGWKNALDGILNSSIPVVIGYGGNDGSLMGYLNKKTGLGNFFWCIRKGETLKKEVEEILNNNNGKLVAIENFDSLMFDLLEALDLKLLDKELQDTAKKRAEAYMESVKKIKEAKAKSPDIEDRKAAKNLYEKVEHESPWNFILRSESEKDLQKKKDILLKGIEKYPDDSSLLLEYTAVLYNSRDIGAVKYCKKLLELEPNNAIINANYALVLTDISKNYGEAEKYYKKAIEIDSDYVINRGNYALFLKNVMKNYDEAERHYKKALQIGPNDFRNNANYALFLEKIRKNYNEAEKYYKKAFELDPSHPNNNGNYAGLLMGLNRINVAEKYLTKAFVLCDKKSLELELYFYQYAHIEESMNNAESKIKKLLKEGVRSEGWDFTLNIETAIKNGHPHPDRLKEYAKMISTPVK